MTSEEYSPSVNLMDYLLKDKTRIELDAFTELSGLLWAEGKEIPPSIQEIKIKFELPEEQARDLENIARLIGLVHEQEVKANMERTL